MERLSRKDVETLFKEQGLELVWKTPNKKETTYAPGKVISPNIGEALHELCHYIVAPKYRRKMINYGLGTGTLDKVLVQPFLTTSGAVEKEEALASCLSIQTLQVTGCRNWMDEMVYSSSRLDAFIHVLWVLLNRGFLDTKFVPKFLPKRMVVRAPLLPGVWVPKNPEKKTVNLYFKDDVYRVKNYGNVKS